MRRDEGTARDRVDGPRHERGDTTHPRGAMMRFAMLCAVVATCALAVTAGVTGC